MLQDILKRPVKVGDTVLTTGYGSTMMNVTTQVKKVTSKYIYVDIPQYSYSDRSYQPKRMRRDVYQFVIINEQLQHNREHYPEYYI